MKLFFSVFLIPIFLLSETAPQTPGGHGQLESPLEWFTAKGSEGEAIKYCGQIETGGKIRLTASNGYFNKGIKAAGTSKRPFIKTPFIANNYESLSGWRSPKNFMRWHIWFENTGNAVFKLDLKSLKEGSEIKAALGKKSFSFKTAKGVSEYKIVLPVEQKGKLSFTLTAIKINGKEVGKLYGIDVFGPAVKGSKLLRSRWRPGAAHTKFTSSKAKETKLWVMSTKSVLPTPSYSPVTTPFGYYGSVIKDDFRHNTSMNFSMWSKLDVPVNQMSHLIAVGSPEADFGGFGHEGTGVKLRGNWQPLAFRPRILTQALRVTYEDGYATYYGYYLKDDGNWNLFCAGRKWQGKKKGKSLWPGAFVEVPGPPQSQRSGDELREVHRRGWVLDNEGKWQPLDQMASGKHNNVNKSWGLSKDGWLVMKMGGMEHFDHKEKGQVKAPASDQLPEFLQSDKAKQLFKMPADFGNVTAVRNGTTAEISFNMKDAGPNARAIIYYGSKDYITFAPRKLHGTEKKSNVLKESGTWEKAAEVKSVVTGENKVKIDGLKGEQFFRILIINDNGRLWEMKSHKM